MKYLKTYNESLYSTSNLHPHCLSIDNALYERCVELIKKYGKPGLGSNKILTIKIPYDGIDNLYIFKNSSGEIGIADNYKKSEYSYYYHFYDDLKKAQHIRDFIMSDELEPMLEADKMGLL